MYLEKSRAKFNRLGGFLENQPKPCSMEEIRNLETILTCQFPEAYREFLSWMGHGGGTFLQGTDIFYDHILDIQDWAKELLAENNFPESLPNDAVVFMMHQGYQFMFFRTSEGHNPPIYYYHEACHSEDFELKFSNLDEYLLAEMDFEI